MPIDRRPRFIHHDYFNLSRQIQPANECLRLPTRSPVSDRDNLYLKLLGQGPKPIRRLLSLLIAGVWENRLIVQQLPLTIQANDLTPVRNPGSIPSPASPQAAAKGAVP